MMWYSVGAWARDPAITEYDGGWQQLVVADRYPSSLTTSITVVMTPYYWPSSTTSSSSSGVPTSGPDHVDEMSMHVRARRRRPPRPWACDGPRPAGATIRWAKASWTTARPGSPLSSSWSRLAIFVAVMTLIFTQVSTSLQQTAAIDSSTASAAASRLAIDQLITDLRQSGTGDHRRPRRRRHQRDHGDDLHARSWRTDAYAQGVYRLTGSSWSAPRSSAANSGAAPWSFPVITPTWRSVLVGVTNNDLFAFADDDGAATTDPADVLNVEIHTRAAVQARN